METKFKSKEIKNIQFSSNVIQLGYTPSGDHLICASNLSNDLDFYNFIDYTHAFKLSGHKFNCSSFAFFKNSTKLATGSYDKTIRIWDLENRKTENVLASDSISKIDCSENMILCSHWFKEIVSLFNTKKKIKEVINCVAKRIKFTEDGKKFITCEENGNVRFWDLEKMKAIVRHESQHDPSAAGLAFTKDGNFFLSGGGDNIFVYNLNGEIVREFKLDTNCMGNICFSPCGKYLAIGFEIPKVENVCILDFVSGKILGKLKQEPVVVLDVCWSQDQKYIITASGDESIRIYDIEGIDNSNENIIEKSLNENYKNLENCDNWIIEDEQKFIEKIHTQQFKIKK